MQHACLKDAKQNRVDYCYQHCHYHWTPLRTVALSVAGGKKKKTKKKAPSYWYCHYASNSINDAFCIHNNQMLPPSPITALLYLPRADSASPTRGLLRRRSWPRDGEITAMKNPSPGGPRALNPPSADLWDAAGWGWWWWSPAAGSGLLLSWRYRHLAAGGQQASWSPRPTGHKTGGQAGKKKTQRSSKLTPSHPWGSQLAKSTAEMPTPCQPPSRRDPA